MKVYFITTLLRFVCFLTYFYVQKNLKKKEAGNSFFEQIPETKQVFEEILENNSFYIITGLTVQSCVKKSTEALVEHVKGNPQKKIAIVRDLVSGRSNGKKQEEKIIEKWKQSSAVDLFHSWEDLQITLNLHSS